MTGATAQATEMFTSPALPGAAERGLMRALLEDAIGCLTGEIGHRRERHILAADARQWIEDRDRQWPFSFENVCDGLDIDADYLRERLLRTATTPPVSRARRTPPSVRVSGSMPDEHEVGQMIRSGVPLRMVAERFGISVSKVSVLSCGLASRMKAARDSQIRDLRRAGWTYRTLAAHFGLSRIRVMRICTRPTRGVADNRRSAA